MLKENFIKILSLLKEAGQISGRTKFQKIVYILKNKDIQFKEKFKYHYFGPFSSDLQLEIDELTDRGIVIEKSVNPYVYEVNQINNIEFEQDSQIKGKKNLIHFLNQKDSKILELTSTIYFLENNGIKEERILRKKILALKPHLNDYIEDSFQLKEEIDMM